MDAAPAGRPEQLWLDVARPIQPRPPRERRTKGPRVAQDAPSISPQMELRMSPCPVVPAARARAPEVAPVATPPPPSPPPPQAPIPETRPCFVTWLVGQIKSGGAIGELAKAARADRLFPRTGSAEAVRARFGKAGADGDAYAALEDAERAYDRAA